jgi:hypothetical protein
MAKVIRLERCKHMDVICPYDGTSDCDKGMEGTLFKGCRYSRGEVIKICEKSREICSPR